MTDQPKQEGLFDCRKAWAMTLEALARDDDRIVAVVNDSVGSSNLGGFQKAFGDRLINVGIAEQNMVGVGAGLANGGRIPFVSAASCFLSGRALEQIKADVAYSNYNVKLVGQSSGVAYGELGATHHSIEDFAWLRALERLTVIAPADPWETEMAIRWAAGHTGPVFLRLSRMKVPDLGLDVDGQRQFSVGKARLLRKGSDVTILATGTTVHLALCAAEDLSHAGQSAQVYSVHTLNPLDEATILENAAQTGAIVTCEEALVRGGLGGAVAELTSANTPIPVERVGFQGFQKTGPVDWLFEQNGITAQGIAEAARKAIARKS
ncbi:MAG: transketolase C-terminal domain-containing protein [Pseudomonadota bacterium]